MSTRKVVSITLKKEVASPEAAQAIVNIVKAKLADQPDVTVRGSYSEQFEIEE